MPRRTSRTLLAAAVGALAVLAAGCVAHLPTREALSQGEGVVAVSITSNAERASWISSLELVRLDGASFGVRPGSPPRLLDPTRGKGPGRSWSRTPSA